MLVYQGFDIGTAKPDLEERSRVKHHLIDILAPDADFSAASFQKIAGALITDLNKSGIIPILAGGTGLYVRSLLEGYQFNQTAGDANLRRELEELAQKEGKEKLHALLAAKVPETAARLHPNDTRRIIRALEVYYHSGEKISEEKSAYGKLLYNAAVFGLTMDRALLYERINQRVDLMLEQGLVAEVAGLLEKGVKKNSTAMQGIGYKEIAAYLAGEYSLTAASEKIKQATRHFAKRQLTWYRRMPYVEWFEVAKEENYAQTLAEIYKLLARKFLIE
jgi:tRNA dimethylallyltransferase